MMHTTLRPSPLLLLSLVIGMPLSCPVPAQPAAAPPNAPVSPVEAAKTFKQDIPSAAFAIEMVRIPGDPAQKLAPFYMSKTEITWDAFDIFIYKLDIPEDDRPKHETDHNDEPRPDTITRPTKPYLPPDRGFGHEGFPAITMSHTCATEFCKWLSDKSGRKFRLPTEAEWEHAARAGSDTPCEPITDCAWFKDNADAKTHSVASKKPNAFGLFDMFGNVAEWCNDAQGKPVAKGGSFIKDAAAMNASFREPPKREWNATDPQIPKSKWWLADATFIGFRIVCDTTDPSLPPTPATNPNDNKPKEGAK